MIVLFTDFGVEGPYVGQMEAVLKRSAPEATVIHLLHNAPFANPGLSSYLLAALRYDFSVSSVFLTVVDPGVGGDRTGVVLKADGRFFVGPHNGLLNTVAIQSVSTQWWEISWLPERRSRSFHGRDWFAPVAAAIFNKQHEGLLSSFIGPDLDSWQADINQIIYFDHYGNAMTGLRYHADMDGCMIEIGGKRIIQANTFCSVPQGQAFWYRNSINLVEIAVNQGQAQKNLSLVLGQEFEVL